MCRNIRTLFNFEPPTTEDEVRAAALQFVRKVSGMHSPSRANEVAFEHAVEQISWSTSDLLSALVTAAHPKDRQLEAERAKARWRARQERSLAAADRPSQ